MLGFRSILSLLFIQSKPLPHGTHLVDNVEMRPPESPRVFGQFAVDPSGPRR